MERHPATALDDSSIHLFKLHGSVDWGRKSLEGTALGDTTVDWTSYEPVPDQERGMFGWSLEPGLVFGGDNKLRADGPFLDLFRGFADAIKDCDRLVVIGYSLRDPHVNQLIQDWGSRDRELILVDPNAGDLRRTAANVVLPHSLRIYALPVALSDERGGHLRRVLFDDLDPNDLLLAAD